jgi:hypothetical protein
MPVGSTPRDSGNIPLGSAISPGDTTPQAIQGGIEYTDANSIITTPLSASQADHWKATYSACVIGLVPGATPQDIFTITGSSSKTIRVLRLDVTGQATAAQPLDVVILKRSTANSAGTSSAVTAVPHDSNDTATATVLSYTVNPTAGTLVGNLRASKLTLGIKTAATTDINADHFTEFFGNRPGKAVVLRGTAQVLAVNLNGITAISGWVFNINIEWSEE